MTRRLFLVGVLVATLANCGGDESVKVGAVLPLTGEFDLYGQSIRNGVALAYSEILEQSDYPYTLDLQIIDSESNPAKGQELLEQVYRGGAIAALGGVTTAEALQMVAVADRFDRILLSPSASSPELTGLSKNFYRVFPSDSHEGTTMGNFAARKLQLETVVILAKESAFAKGILEIFHTEFERNGGDVIEVIEYPPGAADFSGFVERILALEPKGVYLAAYANDVAPMITQLRTRGYDGTILTTAAFASPVVIEQVGEPAEGVFLTQAVFDLASEDPLIQGFVAAYKEEYGLDPDLYSAHGYDAMRVLAEVLKNGGTIASDFWKGMSSLRDFTGVTGTIQFNERGDVQKFPRVYVVDDGNLVDYEKEVERKRKELLQRLRDLEERQRKRSQG